MTTGARAASADTRTLSIPQDAALAVNAFLAVDRSGAGNEESGRRERRQHLAKIQSHYWRGFYVILSGVLSQRRGTLNFTDDQRLFMDLGLIDPRMVDPDRTPQAVRELTAELGEKALSGCFYLTEWLAERHSQLQLNNAIAAAGTESGDNSYETQLNEARRRVLSRLAPHFTGLPGIPLEVSESMRRGDLDRVTIASGIAAIREPTRKNFLRRHHLWAIREQILTKARARAGSQEALKLFELLGEIYTRDWRARFDTHQSDVEREQARTRRESRRLTAATAAAASTAAASATPAPEKHTVSVSEPDVDELMSAARQTHMRIVLLGAIDGKPDADTVLHGRTPRVTKRALAAFLPTAQTFDRALSEVPPIVIVPGSGRGFYAWEAGCILLSLQPMVGLDDSVATALALWRMVDDLLNADGQLRQAYERAFPGAVFQTEFPADYRAWLTRLTKGEAGAMDPRRRAFFRDIVGPDVNKPLVPPNLRNVGPQTLAAICRRMEKQAGGDAPDANLHRRLAAVYWQTGNIEAAGLQFTAAMRDAPDDGETLFAAGMFMRSNGDAEAAADCFRWGKERAAGSMWGIYCQDALANQL